MTAAALAVHSTIYLNPAPTQISHLAFEALLLGIVGALSVFLSTAVSHRRRSPTKSPSADDCAGEDTKVFREFLFRINTGAVMLDEDLTVLSCNNAVADLLGFADPGSLLGCELWKLLGLRQDSQIHDFIRQSFALGEFSIEFEATPSGRDSIWIEAHGAALVTNGSLRVLALLRDVSGRKRRESALSENYRQAAAELQVIRHTIAGKAMFIAKVNHELRTPLNGIIGLSEMLRHMASARSIAGSDIRKFCNSIHQSGTHLLSLIDDLIDISRLEAGAWSLEPSCVAIAAEIDEALLMVESMARQKRIVIENTCPASLEWTLDRRAFRQIVINLVNNAVKFAPSGTRVCLEVSCSDCVMALRVIDQGPGVSPEDRERIMTPFGRGRYADEHRLDGAGLGLCIVSELLKLHGGSLGVKSETDRGSTFSANFPAHIGRPISMQIAAE